MAGFETMFNRIKQSIDELGASLRTRQSAQQKEINELRYRMDKLDKVANTQKGPGTRRRPMPVPDKPDSL